MKRRKLMRYAQAGLLASLGTALTAGVEGYLHQERAIAASGDGVTVQWLGHTCFLFTGGGRRILVNPFRTVGCTAGLRPPRVAADLVMISSQLLDEGSLESVPGQPRLLSEPGVYQLPNLQIQGIATDRSRLKGHWFPSNIVWRWNQGGVNILHLGGAAQPITTEQKILMGRPDLLLLPVGGGAKAYGPQEALQAIQALNPKVVIPTHFLTKAANQAACDLSPIDQFLSMLGGATVRRSADDEVTLRAEDLSSQGTTVQVLSYKL